MSPPTAALHVSLRCLTPHHLPSCVVDFRVCASVSSVFTDKLHCFSGQELNIGFSFRGVVDSQVWMGPDNTETPFWNIASLTYVPPVTRSSLPSVAPMPALNSSDCRKVFACLHNHAEMCPPPNVLPLGFYFEFFCLLCIHFPNTQEPARSKGAFLVRLMWPSKF